jgi:hypothetical protein
MRLPPEDRHEWLVDASNHLQERAAERRRDRLSEGNDRPPTEPVARQLDRRREAKARLPRLSDDDSRRDPHSPSRRDVPVGVGELDSWARALAHLQSVGLAGLPPAPVRQALAALPERYGPVLPRRPAA